MLPEVPNLEDDETREAVEEAVQYFDNLKVEERRYIRTQIVDFHMFFGKLWAMLQFYNTWGRDGRRNNK